jgi:pimeloyl-ACP methyl ester carboxylesterase
MMLSVREMTAVTYPESQRAAAVALHTGVTLPYVQQSDRTGVPVILLHGYSGSWRSWEPVLPNLPGAIRATVPTQSSSSVTPWAAPLPSASPSIIRRRC